MEFFQINQKKRTMTILVMLLLKTAEVAKVVLEDLVDLVGQIFQTFLKIFLEILVVVREALREEVPITEVQT